LKGLKCLKGLKGLESYRLFRSCTKLEYSSLFDSIFVKPWCLGDSVAIFFLPQRHKNTKASRRISTVKGNYKI
jgi:hypothetical protein